MHHLDQLTYSRTSILGCLGPRKPSRKHNPACQLNTSVSFELALPCIAVEQDATTNTCDGTVGSCSSMGVIEQCTFHPCSSLPLPGPVLESLHCGCNLSGLLVTSLPRPSPVPCPFLLRGVSRQVSSLPSLLLSCFVMAWYAAIRDVRGPKVTSHRRLTLSW